MKTILIILITFFSFNLHAQTNDAKIKDIKRLLVASGTIDNAKIAITGMIKLMKQSRANENISEEFWNNFLEEIDYNEIAAIYIPIYDKNYTHEEIIGILAFYESEIGKKTVTKMPIIMQESMAAGQEWGKKIGQKALEKMKEH